MFFYEMNASLYPDFMQTNKVESVPCLFIKKEGIVKEKKSMSFGQFQIFTSIYYNMLLNYFAKILRNYKIIDKVK